MTRQADIKKLVLRTRSKINTERTEVTIIAEEIMKSRRILLAYFITKPMKIPVIPWVTTRIQVREVNPRNKLKSPGRE